MAERSKAAVLKTVRPERVSRVRIPVSPPEKGLNCTPISGHRYVFFVIIHIINKGIMRTTFSSEEIAQLRKNPCVFSCTSNSVNYTYEFKKRALGLHSKSVFAKEIWKRT